MKLLLFAGTAEGRQLTEWLGGMPAVKATVCVATEYGRVVLGATGGNTTVISKRLGREEIEVLATAGAFDLVVDATHPYAAQVTANIQAAVTAAKTPYMRLLRAQSAVQNCRYYSSIRQAAEALNATKGNVLLTTGSKELDAYTVVRDYTKRLYPRVLPAVEAIEKCVALGFAGRHIIAMQGPFSTEMNEAIIRQFGISLLVTKDGGAAGGFPEKTEAAVRTGVDMLVIGRPMQESGYTLEDVMEEIKRRVEEAV